MGPLGNSRCRSAQNRWRVVCAIRVRPSSALRGVDCAVADPADDIAGAGAGIGQEDLLNEEPGRATIGRTSGRPWAPANEQPRCFAGAGPEVRWQERSSLRWCCRPTSRFCGRYHPSSSPSSTPLVRTEARAGAGLRLGEALAPPMLAAGGCAAGNAASAPGPAGRFR